MFFFYQSTPSPKIRALGGVTTRLTHRLLANRAPNPRPFHFIHTLPQQCNRNLRLGSGDPEILTAPTIMKSDATLSRQVFLQGRALCLSSIGFAPGCFCRTRLLLAQQIFLARPSVVFSQAIKQVVVYALYGLQAIELIGRISQRTSSQHRLQSIILLTHLWRFRCPLTFLAFALNSPL